MEMAPCRGSTRNATEQLELLDVMYRTRFNLLDTSWCCGTNLHTGHHPGRNEFCADNLYYDPFTRRNISMEAANNRVSATPVLREGVLDDWTHLQDERQRVPCHSTYDYTDVVWSVIGPSTDVMVVEIVEGGSASGPCHATGVRFGCEVNAEAFPCADRTRLPLGSRSSVTERVDEEVSIPERVWPRTGILIPFVV